MDDMGVTKLSAVFSNRLFPGHVIYVVVIHRQFGINMMVRYVPRF